MANFDAISYSKGQAVLKQPARTPVRRRCSRGLRAYFRDNAWGNTTLEDFVGAVATASGRGARGVAGLVARRGGGTDTLVLAGATGG